MTSGRRADADAGMALIAQQLSQPAPPGPGIGLEAGVSLSVILGGIHAELERRRRYEMALADAVHPVDMPAALMVLTGGAGTLAGMPGYFGPTEGYAWDLKNVVADGFTGGTVNVYKGSAGQAVPANQRFTFTQAGVWTPTGQTALLLPGQWLTFQAAGITGNVTLSGDGIQVKLGFLAAYLL